MRKGTRETADLPAEEHQRRLAEGEGTDTIAADAPERARAAFGLVEKGLRGYAVKE
ncbi:hypothetical protein [Streptomyces sp. NPDC056660]|uniref:hypothetical protein n=1 Tax=Streptomyces sp. NPDC056660 TaxID=3345897 RepID=UPI00368DA78F